MWYEMEIENEDCPKYILEWIKWLNVPIMDVIMGGMWL